MNWPQQRLQQVVSSCAPANSPKIWLSSNLLCLVWSFILAVAIICATTPVDRLTGTHYYLIWSLLATCFIVWSLEAGLIAWHCRQTGSGKLTWAQLIELVIAVYFAGYSSLRVFFVWLDSDDDVAGEFIDIVISVIV
jgi:hypothetical protein